ncbi:hypothetical protein ABID22_001829 [Pontibacter aydingkolensis]|uniref:Lipoprotein n=1 Tax=Pontibacter aydingkolensis TaxID=1911536 RepID=A0ABS7CPM3_9BACT|nr:hypothetical protein [Pontibacter aydingkolensis]MBW7465785.1 hypothetical protein [Pontibacter aydingkolensis]
MKNLLLVFNCLLLGVVFAGCSTEDEVTPCLNARVVDVADPCSDGVVLELTKADASQSAGFCGTPNLYKYVTVNNLPDNLKQVGATFTCQIEKAEGNICPAVYTVYEAATITNICSSDQILPR